MFRELQALIATYFRAYFRVPTRIISDTILAIIIAITMVLSNLANLGFFAAFLYVFMMPFTFLTIVRTTLGEIVAEKESGKKEYLKLNGLSTFTYQLYIYIVTFIKTLFYTLFILVGIYVGAKMAGENSHLEISFTLGQTLLLYALCALSTISFTLFISVFFSDAKLASSVGGIAYASISFVSLIVFNSKNNPYFYYLISLFPQGALVVAMLMNPSEIPKSVTIYTIYDGLIFDFVFYLVLYWYLDQVLRNEHGVRKSVFFFLEWMIPKKRSNVTQSANSGISTQLIPINGDSPRDASIGILTASQVDVSSAIHHEVYDDAPLCKKSVQVVDLSKNFGKFKAVDKVSFPIYQGQIFCLLGSNGAGKTSTIKMMTGLLKIDGGDILYDGESFTRNMKEIRKRIGFCGQQDILYEKIKVHEHLALIARMRHVPEKDIPEMVEETLEQLHLKTEKDKYSEQLSGGNKRKLSLAMSVVGRTKVIFLDEPTSGMDPQNKRVMWKHLKELKRQGLTILLTTHHLDEADELSDRLAIMSRGKMLAIGTSEYMKKKFGTGYHLTLTPNYEMTSVEKFIQRKSELFNVVKSVIPSAQFDDQTSSDVLKCSLPFSAQNSYSELFAKLEELEIAKIGVEMNTLEDVFVNLNQMEGQDPNVSLNFNIDPPECLSEKPSYDFIKQTIALAKRRIFIMTRSGRDIFLMILPIMLVAFGIVGSTGMGGPYSTLNLFLIVLLISYSLNAGTYCSLPVYERELKIKYLMEVMGLRNIPYWIGNVIIDFFFITLMNFGLYGLYIWLYNLLEGMTQGEDIPGLTFIDPIPFLIISIPHGFALVTIGYMWSFMFNQALSAVKYFPLFYFFVLFMGGTVAVVELQDNHPFWSGVVGVICPTTIYIEFIATIEGFSLSLHEVVWFELAYALVYFVIAIIIEFSRLKFSWGTKRTPTAMLRGSEIMPINHDDIVNEKNRMEQSPEDPIKVTELAKTYKNGYTAVQDISFGVEKGQIFGLLGPNGAGKSTTFNILTAATAKSHGSVKLLNHEVTRNMPELFENVGICAQTNALWDHLTVEEHLTFFGNLKGLSGANLKAAIDYYLDALYLREYQKKKACELSGGNKRKLCVANAFIGAAHLIFLDEPSSGVDPVARRFLWSVIQKTLRLRTASIVLTTHSMYEAESLSDKIGILINGQFVCLGSTHRLKERYSQGYKFTVSLAPNIPNPMPKLLEELPEAKRGVHNSYVQQTYHLPAKGVKFSETFEKLEEIKNKGIIKDFSLYSTSLEQIFMNFSKFQINPEGESFDDEISPH